MLTPPLYRLLQWLLTVTVIVGPALVQAQEMAVEAELPTALAAEHLHADSMFVLKVRSPWSQGECRLVPGALLHATVKEVKRTPNGRVEQLSFLVGAPCGDKSPVELVVTSLLAPPKVESTVESFSSFGSFGAGMQPQPQSAPLSFDASATQHSSSVVTLGQDEHNKLPGTVKLGEVWHLAHIRLVLPPSGSPVSTVVTTGSSLRLPEAALFVLQSARSAGHSAGTLVASGGHGTAEKRTPVRAFIGACRAGICSSYPSATTPGGFGFVPKDIHSDLSALGFRPEHDREIAELEPATTVHFLDAGELLVTFPSHQLIPRTADEQPTDNRRTVRAVLFNIGAQQVERILDWVVNDHHRYVWCMGSNLLVHAGGALTLYGPGLKEIATLPLTKPLAALQPSPDGEHLMLGELRELHSAEDHRLLMETDAHGPQEEVSWSLLDEHLQRLRALGTTSNFVPTPVLSNRSMIELRKGPDPEWSLVGSPLEGGAMKQLGGLRSGCMPALSDVSPDLLTVGTCDVHGDGMHTFVLREDGSPIVEKALDAQTMPVSFASASATPRVAMMLTRASEAYSRGLLFHLSVIQTQAIEVVALGNGGVIARVPVPETAPFREPFALSPDGSTLALLSGHQLSLFTLRP